jgi:2-methylisocitrate lyase-like PEP mutase family enzyme
VARGFPVFATSSGAVAASLGYPDNDTMPPDEAFSAIGRIRTAGEQLPLTADIESGYGLAPEVIVERLLQAGAVGCNFEDTDHHGAGELIEPDVQAAKIVRLKEAARAMGVEVVLNARVDVFRGHDAIDTKIFDDGVNRARLYVEAGADCVFPITLSVEQAIAEFVDAIAAPVNILLRPGVPSIARLTEIGVKRISVGGGMMRLAFREIERELDRLRTEVDSL